MPGYSTYSTTSYVSAPPSSLASFTMNTGASPLVNSSLNGGGVAPHSPITNSRQSTNNDAPVSRRGGNNGAAANNTTGLSAAQQEAVAAMAITPDQTKAYRWVRE